MHSTSAHSGWQEFLPSTSESRGVQAACSENQDFLQRRQTRTDAHEPRASPWLKGTSKSYLQTSPVKHQRPCWASRAAAPSCPGPGSTAGPSRWGKTWASPSPSQLQPTEACLWTDSRDTPLGVTIQNETPAGRWCVITNTNPWNRICFNFLTIHTLAFSTVSSRTGFSQNTCPESPLSFAKVMPSLTIICKAIPRLPTAPGWHNHSTGALFAHTK